MAVINGVLSTVLLALCLNSLRVEGIYIGCTKLCENLCYYNIQLWSLLRRAYLLGEIHVRYNIKLMHIHVSVFLLYCGDWSNRDTIVLLQ